MKRLLLIGSIRFSKDFLSLDISLMGEIIIVLSVRRHDAYNYTKHRALCTKIFYEFHKLVIRVKIRHLIFIIITT